MNETVKILGIAGSLRRESYNRSALKAAIDLTPADARLEPFELDGIPVFNQDYEQSPPPAVVELKRRIREADAILFVTPEYNYGESAIPPAANVCLSQHVRCESTGSDDRKGSRADRSGRQLD